MRPNQRQACTVARRRARVPFFRLARSRAPRVVAPPGVACDTGRRKNGPVARATGPAPRLARGPKPVSGADAGINQRFPSAADAGKNHAWRHVQRRVAPDRNPRRRTADSSRNVRGSYRHHGPLLPARGAAGHAVPHPTPGVAASSGTRNVRTVVGRTAADAVPGRCSVPAAADCWHDDLHHPVDDAPESRCFAAGLVAVAVHTGCADPDAALMCSAARHAVAGGGRISAVAASDCRNGPR